jgi:hypothetical protein
MTSLYAISSRFSKPRRTGGCNSPTSIEVSGPFSGRRRGDWKRALVIVQPETVVRWQPPAPVVSENSAEAQAWTELRGLRARLGPWSRPSRFGSFL